MHTSTHHPSLSVIGMMRCWWSGSTPMLAGIGSRSASHVPDSSHKRTRCGPTTMTKPRRLLLPVQPILLGSLGGFGLLPVQPILLGLLGGFGLRGSLTLSDQRWLIQKELTCKGWRFIC